MARRGWTGITVALGMICAAIVTGCGYIGSDTMVTEPTSARSEASNTLYRAVGARNGTLRAQAIESLAVAEGSAAGDEFLRALDDEAVAVRFVAAMAIGDIEHAPATAKLRQMATAENVDPNVLSGVIYALHRLGDNTHMSRLGMLLYDRSPEVRANAALVMGKVGLPAAVRPLRSRLIMERDPGVRLQIAESMAALGEQRSYGILSSYARVGEPHERLAAIQALGRTRSLRAKGTVLYAIGSYQPPPLRLVAAGALAQMGDNRGYGLAMEAVRDPKEFTQRSSDRPVTVSAAQMQQMQSLGAMALAEMGKRQAVDALVTLLDSPNPTVRISAARAILILLGRATPSVAAGPMVDPTPAAQGDAKAEPAGDASADAAEPVLRTAPMKQ